jgi:hypothetical protein
MSDAALWFGGFLLGISVGMAIGYYYFTNIED